MICSKNLCITLNLILVRTIYIVFIQFSGLNWKLPAIGKFEIRVAVLQLLNFYAIYRN
jgi:hypothetical protein